jgi:hypothetical protein
MNLLELQVLTEGAITLKTPDAEIVFESRSAIPDKYMNYIVNSVSSVNNRVFIQLDYPKQVKSLEELGYNFECGM